MLRAGRAAVVVGLSVAALGLLALFVLRPWWQESVPEGLQMPVGLIALALGMGLFLWLKQTPKSLGTRRTRRRRLRDRAQRTDEAE